MKLHELEKAQRLIREMADAQRCANNLQQGAVLIEIKHPQMHFNEEAREAIHKAAHEYYVAEVARIRSSIEELGVEL